MAALEEPCSVVLSRMQRGAGEAQNLGAAAKAATATLAQQRAELDKAIADKRADAEALDAQNEAKRRVSAELDAQIRALHVELDAVTTALNAARRLSVSA